MKEIQWRYSTPESVWQAGTPITAKGKANLRLNGAEYQKMFGFGGCFNEQGYEALKTLPENKQDSLLKELFAADSEACKLNFCRMPIGANDYAMDWYSLDETPGDYALEHFSIDRDKERLIPYIQKAKTYAPDLKLFASPWSPPTWMKNPPVYNWGKLIWEPKNLQAYADYFAIFVKEYQREGITIDQIHVQNEPVANQKFPSCMWTGAELKEFIRDYLGPTFKKDGLDTEIWLGTINAPGCDYNRLIFDKWATEDYDYFANTVLEDEEARQYITGVSYQWGGKIAIQRTFESWWPELRLMQSENECGFGDNTWEYATYVWTMLKHYIGNGAESYMYWNLILAPWGVSTWGDPQNAMVTVQNGDYTLNPDFYVMKHFSNAVQRGAVRLGAAGHWAADALIFRNPDGSYAVEAFNPFHEEKCLTVELEGEVTSFMLAPRSFNSMIITV